MSRWFRHYAGMMRDEKLVRAALKAEQPIERVLWVWGSILESASEINDGGHYELDHAECAYFLRVSAGDIQAIENSLEILGRVREGSVGKWGSRQFQSDRSADRQQRYRERNRTAHGPEGSNGGQGISTVTVPSSDGEVTSPSRHGDAPDTETYTEAKTEKKESVRAVARATRPSADEFFERFWSAYPRRGTAANPKKPARDKFDRAVKSGADPETIIAAAKRFSEVERSDGRFGTEKVAQAVTWLNQQRWGDYTEPAATSGPPAPPDPSMPTDAQLRAHYAQKIPDRTSEAQSVFREGDGAYPADEGALHHPIGRA